MDSAIARGKIAAYLQVNFGKVVSLRDISVVRSSSGRNWLGQLYCVSSRGDIDVGTITVAETGEITDAPAVDGLIDALANIGALAAAPIVDDGSGGSLSQDDFSDLLSGDEDGFGGDETFGDETFGDEDFSEVDQFFEQMDHVDLRSQIVELLCGGTPEELEKARGLLPQLLTDPVGRGIVLRQMGELEQRLGNDGLAVEYFNAAAREFADRGNLDALRYVAEVAATLLGDSYETHTIKRIFDQTNKKMQPVDQLVKIDSFAGLGDEALFEITGAAELIQLEEGEVLLKEGDPAVRAFVIKSGLLKVELETPDGTAQLARCCFPGEFVGETSVLGKEGATCTATVIAKRPAVLWSFDGARLRSLAADYPRLQGRIEVARTKHRVDSFFAMNEATGSLDARVRDQLLGCICAIKRVEEGTVLGRAGLQPEEVYLISKGTIEYRRGKGSVIKYEQDSFVGLGDTLHELLLEGDLIATTPCRLLVFDNRRLKALAAAAPHDVLAVLERLG